MGLVHAWWQLAQGAVPSITHLRAVNPYVESGLQRGSGGSFLPRQQAPAAAASAAALGEVCTSISSFAFQVSVQLFTRASLQYGCWSSTEPHAAPFHSFAGNQCTHADELAARAAGGPGSSCRHVAAHSLLARPCSAPTAAPLVASSQQGCT